MVIYRQLSPSAVRYIWSAIKKVSLETNSDEVQHKKLLEELDGNSNENGKYFIEELFITVNPLKRDFFRESIKFCRK